MRWLLILPLIVGCDRLRPTAKAVERPADSVRTVAVAPVPDTTIPVVAPPVPDSAAVVPDSLRAPVVDSAVASGPDSSVVAQQGGVAGVRRELVIPAGLATLPPVPDNEPIEFDNEGGPVLPHVMHGDCEGDRCSEGFVARSCAETTLRSAASVDASIVARIPEGEPLRVRPDLHLQEAGVVVAKQDFELDWDDTPRGAVARADTVHLAEGDTVHVLRYLERGRWTWVYHGRLHDSGEFWATINRNGTKRMESEYAVRRSLPRREQWWMVTRVDGTTGWWLQAVRGERAEAETHDELQPVSRRKGVDDCAAVKERIARRGAR